MMTKKNPHIHSEYIIKVNDMIKGNASTKQKISVMMRGDSLDGVTAYTKSIDIESGDDVIILLGKDINSIWRGEIHTHQFQSPNPHTTWKIYQSIQRPSEKTFKKQ